MKHLLITVGLIVHGACFAQTDQLNMEKYWKFRNSFKERFVKIGPNQGESLPAGALRPLDCVDNINNDGEGYGWMHWGDGMIRQGHYLGLLATEYKLLKNNGQDLTAVRNELYHALMAIRRLDLAAEENQDFFYGLTLTSSLNGFYNREDVGEDFATVNWGSDDIEMRCTNSAFYKNNNAAKQNGGDYFNEGNSYQNVPSLDQMSSLLVGLRLVHLLVGDEMVQPAGATVAFSLRDIARDIMHRMVSYAADRNWFILDVNGWPVTNGGGDLILMRNPIVETYNKMVGATSIYTNRSAFRKIGGYKKIQLAVTGYGTDESGPTAQQAALNSLNILQNSRMIEISNALPTNGADPNISRFLSWQFNGINIPVSATSSLWTNYIPNSYPALYDDWMDDHKFNSTIGGVLGTIEFEDINITDYNNTIMFNMGVASGLWDDNAVHIWGNFTGNRQLELINFVLNGGSPFQSRTFYQDFLNTMDFSGPYSLEAGFFGSNISHGKYHANGWASEYRWTHPSESVNGNGNRGIYSGLDYMLFHNLYYLIYGSPTTAFQEQYSCGCTAPIEFPIPTNGNTGSIGAAENLNKKLAFVETCNKDVFKAVSNVISSPFTVGPKFSNYESWGITPMKFQSINTSILSAGHVSVQAPLTICGSQLTINNGGKLTVEKHKVTIGTNAKINSSSEVRIKSGTQLIISNQGTLTLNSGSKLIIEDNAKLIIQTGGTLEYYNGGQIITEGANNEIVMAGNIKLMNATTTFKINHSASSQSGRILMEGGKFIGAVPGTKVELTGKNNTDEFIVLKANTPFVVDNTNVASFSIEKCNVMIPQGSSIRIEQPFYTETANFGSSFNNGGITVTETAVLSRSHFNNTYIKAPLGIENVGTIKLVECSFSRSNTALNSTVSSYLEVNGGGYEVHHTVFTNPSQTCIYSSAMTFPSKIQNSTFSHPSGNGFGLRDYSATEIHLYGSSFNKLASGIIKTNGKLSLRCNTFQNNTAFNAEVNLGTLLNMSADDNAGYNALYKTSTGQNIIMQSASFNLANGYNYIEEGSLSAITGTYSAYCSGFWGCMLFTPKNQWNPSNTMPSASKLSLTSINGNAMEVLTYPDVVKPACNPLGPVNPGEPGTAGKSMSAADGTPMILTSFNDSISLKTAIAMGMNKMEFLDTLGNDLEAIEIFNDVFTNAVSKSDSISGPLLRFAFTQMKTAVENAFTNGKITREANAYSFEPHVAMYVNALMYMSDSVIDASNYVPQYYHEMDKAHLFRLTGHSEIGMNILSGLENCGLDSTEQQHLNHWKAIFERDLIAEEIGTEILDTVIVIDTLNYIAPQLLALNEYYFGARINGLYDIDYPNCDYYHFSKMKKAEAKPEFALYPNPASDVVNIVLNHPSGSGGTSLLTFQNAEGKLIHQASFSETENKQKTINVSDWKPGIYIYKYTIPNGKVFTGKLIVK